MRKPRHTTRTMKEVQSRLETLPDDSPPEEFQMLRWFMRMGDYPKWRLEVKKQVNASVLLDPNKIKVKGVASPSSPINLQEILSIENEDHSTEVLKGLKPPNGFKAIPSLEGMKRSFEENQYFISSDDAFTVHQCLLSGRALLIAGPPGVGKTELAKQIALALGLDVDNHNHFSTLFCTPDIGVREAIYKWNDAKRLLDLQLLNSVLGAYQDRNQVMSLYKEVAANAYSLRYLEIMPILRACLIPFRTVRLIDEIDKTYPTFDNLLLDILQRFAFEVPEYGTIGTPTDDTGDKPVYVIVSNDTRELSAMLVSRCVTLWLDYLPENLEAKVIHTKAKVSVPDAGLIASFFRKIREMVINKELRLNNPPSTREVIATAQGLVKNKFECSDKNLFALHAYWIKNRRDYDAIRAKFHAKGEWNSLN